MKKKHRGIESIKSRSGFLFTLPWLIGMIIFILVPVIKSFWYSFADVMVTDNGIETKFNSFETFKYLFTQDPTYVTSLRESIGTFLYSLPIIVILSLIFAMILSSNFKGRLFARGLFFLPVIIASGIVIELINSETSGQPVGMSLTGGNGGYTSNMMDFNDILVSLGFDDKIIEFLSEYISKIFDLIWSIGIQVLLFISGLNAIPKQYYEVAKVEGASKWSEFLFITIPSLGNVILLVSCYTMIELFVSDKNPVVSSAYNAMDKLMYDRSSAMLWIYFAIIAVVAFAVFGLYNRLCLKKWS